MKLKSLTHISPTHRQYRVTNSSSRVARIEVKVEGPASTYSGVVFDPFGSFVKHLNPETYNTAADRYDEFDRVYQFIMMYM